MTSWVKAVEEADLRIFFEKHGLEPIEPIEPGLDILVFVRRPVDCAMPHLYGKCSPLTLPLRWQSLIGEVVNGWEGVLEEW